MLPACFHSCTRIFRRTKTNAILAVFIVALIAWLAFNRKPYVEPLKEARIHEEVRAVLLEASYKKYGMECSPTTKYCFQVVDRILEDKNTFDYLHNPLLQVFRYMTLIHLKGYSNSGVLLKTPEKLTWENSNSSCWPVDKAFTPEGYFQMMIVAPFSTEAMSDRKTQKQRVLLLGLGGGSIPNFLSIIETFNLDIETTIVEIDPFMVGMTKKYFDFKPLEGRTTLIVDDGVKALKEAVQKGNTYNSLMLDACCSSLQKSGLLCPVKEFFIRETIQDMYNVLEENGTLSINTVFDTNEKEWQRQSKKKMMEFFPSCDFIPFGRETEMLICTKKPAWSWELQRPRFSQNLLRVNKLFGFRLNRFF